MSRPRCGSAAPRPRRRGGHQFHDRQDPQPGAFGPARARGGQRAFAGTSALGDGGPGRVARFSFWQAL
eukprot:11178695-Lingulodinium_polyedra.AAC.1